ncbi:FAD binding domain-containing protein [Blautia sp. HCP3S3_H10_1]|uniref:FAD binding domain-containing protein n=1 Tax=unclassified Blautia TaxID=2648079 RepID=UPI003F92A9B7|nr:FAD binding domain-containing protein [Clostridia bacterium]
MLKIKNYVKVESLEEAYELNQKRTACVLGGMVWLKMGNRNITTAIDLSGLGLDTITETEDEFVIGCMTPLRDLELHKGLDTYTNGAVRESLRHIVGVQFRNCATVGGSIWGRFGFSDVLTMFLALDTEVELFKGGRVCLSEFVKMPKDRDILVRIVVKKTPVKTCYLSQRNTKTDFPVLACCVSLSESGVKAVYGARPAKAFLLEDKEHLLDGMENLNDSEKKEVWEKFAEYAATHVSTAGNMRGSAAYRTLLVKVLTRRALEAVGGMTDEN